MGKHDQDAAAHWRKHAQLNEEMIRDHESGLHVHSPSFIEWVKMKTAMLWRVVAAYEKKDAQGS